MKIIINIGESRTLLETHTFDNQSDASQFLAAQVPQLSSGDLAEIMSSPDTQFDVDQLFNFPEQEAAYWGRFRYEIEVQPGPPNP